MNHAQCFQYPARFIQLDVDPVEVLRQLRNIAGAPAGFVREDRHVHFASDVLHIFELRLFWLIALFSFAMGFYWEFRRAAR